MSDISIGVDIGKRYAKIVCLQADKLIGYGLFSYLGNEEMLKKVISESDIPGGDVRVNIEDPSIKIRRVDLPIMDENDIQEAVKWSLKDIIDGDVDEFVFRYMMIDNEDLHVEGKQPVVAFAIKNEPVDIRIKSVKDVGLGKPSIVEPNASALANIYYYNKSTDQERDDVVLNLGYQMPLFTVMGRKNILFSRPMDCCSGLYLQDLISKELDIDSEKALQTKEDYRKFGDEKFEPETREKIQKVFETFYAKMAVEVQRSIDAYSLMFQGKHINKIYLSGGEAYCNNLAENIGKALGHKTEIFDPFEKIDTSSYSSHQIGNVKALFTIACGLAIDQRDQGE